MSLLGIIAGAVHTPPEPVDLSDLPDLIPGGERPHPYTFPAAAPYTVPTAAVVPPPAGYPTNEMVHPSVVDTVAHGFPTGFRGFRYWMAITPYPGQNDRYENPCVYVSNNGWEWQPPAGLTNPIDNPPASWYYSDTDMVWDPDGQRFVLWWRNIGAGYYAATSTDGVNWTKHGLLHTPGTPVSPTITRRGPGDWWMFVGSQFSGATFGRYRSASPLGPWGDYMETPITAASMADLWHHEVKWHADLGAFLMAAVTRGWVTIPAVSTDGTTWVAADTGIPGVKSYRGSLAPADDPAWFDLWMSGDWYLWHTRVPRSLWTNLL